MSWTHIWFITTASQYYHGCWSCDEGERGVGRVGIDQQPNEPKSHPTCPTLSFLSLSLSGHGYYVGLSFQQVNFGTQNEYFWNVKIGKPEFWDYTVLKNRLHWRGTFEESFPIFHHSSDSHRSFVPQHSALNRRIVYRKLQ